MIDCNQVWATIDNRVEYNQLLELAKFSRVAKEETFFHGIQESLCRGMEVKIFLEIVGKLCPGSVAFYLENEENLFVACLCLETERVMEILVFCLHRCCVVCLTID